MEAYSELLKLLMAEKFTEIHLTDNTNKFYSFSVKFHVSLENFLRLNNNVFNLKKLHHNLIIKIIFNSVTLLHPHIKADFSLIKFSLPFSSF